ncbi:MAG: hypothetical protein JW891_09030 [Candidatus Lokiarchaeota archaeon]|nr:hypothetical protein [Candidatus Lokiarchaeota archaeon]
MYDMYTEYEKKIEEYNAYIDGLMAQIQQYELVVREKDYEIARLKEEIEKFRGQNIPFQNHMQARTPPTPKSPPAPAYDVKVSVSPRERSPSDYRTVLKATPVPSQIHDSKSSHPHKELPPTHPFYKESHNKQKSEKDEQKSQSQESKISSPPAPPPRSPPTHSSSLESSRLQSPPTRGPPTRPPSMMPPRAQAPPSNTPPAYPQNNTPPHIQAHSPRLNAPPPPQMQAPPVREAEYQDPYDYNPYNTSYEQDTYNPSSYEQDSYTSDGQPYTPRPSATYSKSTGILTRICPNCNAMGFAIKEVDDKTQILSYVPKRIYAKKRVCTKCFHEF